ncbi:hypothetical protein BKA59DRAFT_556723 [Fusarium tricinctum]|uniref:Uncharacterized protein n=1 Tax=Fusarium tricinctum TaxID=61284 RepID=A0A8K0RTY0_9HYPO|nr:hypothetical protein BKA59DRAFT_556723 [Fusarium tricinctum]
MMSYTRTLSPSPDVEPGQDRVKILEEELRLAKEKILQMTADTETQLTTIKDGFEKQSAKQAQELAEAKSECDDFKYKVEVLKELLDGLENLTEEINFNTIHRTLQRAIQQHKVLAHFAKSFRETVDDAEPTGETSTRMDLKRKMEIDLYEPNKKMRHSIDIDLSQLSRQSAAEYTRMVNTDVFRLAGRAGLISPFHFDVKKDGIVSLTDIALRKVNIAEKAAELSTQLRNILHEFNLWDQGHRSVKPLRDGLSEEKIMSPGNMYECLTEVMLAVKEDLSAFDNALKAVEHYDRYYATHELLVSLSKHGRKLYVDYKTGRFSGESIIKWGRMTDFYEPRREVLSYFGKLSAGYHRLIGFREVIEREAQITDHLVAPEDNNNPDNMLEDMPIKLLQ